MISGVREFRIDDGLNRWQRWTEWPLIVLGLAFLVVLILPLATPLTPTEDDLLGVLNVTIWAVFVVDYTVRLLLAINRRKFIRAHILDLIVIAVPFLRPFRALRLIAIVISTSRRAGGVAVQRVTIYVVAVALIVMATSAVIVYDAEHQAEGANITSLTDSLWWAVTTVTTVGYGDRYPVTGTGRAMAALLMFTGIALVGTITAAVAAGFVNMVRRSSNFEVEKKASDERADLKDEVALLNTTVDLLRVEIAAMRSELNGVVDR